MKAELLSTFDDLSIANKRNEIVSLLMKADMLLNQLPFENELHREIKNYVYSQEDEDVYLNDLYRNVYNLVNNITDYLYFLANNSKKDSQL